MGPRAVLRAVGRLLRLPLAPPPPPVRLGARDGRLAPCRGRNCVASGQGAGTRGLAPLPNLGGRDATLARIREVVGAERGARVVAEAPGYLRAEFTTPFWRFVDDAEFLWDEQERVVHFRSASRVGRSDLGANRRRMQRIRARLLHDGGA